MNNLDMQMVGETIFYASIQFSIGSVEMSSKFSVRNFAKDEETLQCAIDALNDYMIIGTVWAIGCCLLQSAKYGINGLITAILANLLIMGWIYISYMNAFSIARKKMNENKSTTLKFDENKLAFNERMSNSLTMRDMKKNIS